MSLPNGIAAEQAEFLEFLETNGFFQAFLAMKAANVSVPKVVEPLIAQQVSARSLLRQIPKDGVDRSGMAGKPATKKQLRVIAEFAAKKGIEVKIPKAGLTMIEASIIRAYLK